MKVKLIVLVVTIAASMVVAWLSNVPVSLTMGDRKAAGKISRDSQIYPLKKNEKNDFLIQLNKLNQVLQYFQQSIQESRHAFIPMDQPRELENWYSNRTGICWDVTRASEAFLSYLGFQVRHVSIYSLVSNSSPYIAFVTPRNASHAVTEVLTSRGWMLFDPNYGKLYVDEKGVPIAVSEVHDALKSERIALKSAHEIFNSNYLAIYGLYSRHGRFYPPYVPVPDVSWVDFVQYGCCEVVR